MCGGYINPTKYRREEVFPLPIRRYQRFTPDATQQRSPTRDDQRPGTSHVPRRGEKIAAPPILAIPGVISLHLLWESHSDAEMYLNGCSPDPRRYDGDTPHANSRNASRQRWTMAMALAAVHGTPSTGADLGFGASRIISPRGPTGGWSGSGSAPERVFPG